MNISDHCRDLSFATPDGCHEIAIDLRAQLGADMAPVLRVRGQATQDGKLQLIVTHGPNEQQRVIEVAEANRLPEEDRV